jgi:two-component system response regulator
MNEKLILLIEDDIDHEKITLQALKEGNMYPQTMVVRDGQEAIEYIFKIGKFSDRQTGNPQVILLDLKLPKIDGLEVLQKIRENPSTKNIPVVILTSSQLETDLISSYNYGANSFILKPLDLDKFNTVIQHFLYYWSSINKNIS